MVPTGGFIRDFGAGGSTGLFLHVDRGKFGQLSYTLRVEDVYSPVNPQPGFPRRPIHGTELPLVHEREFRTRIRLLNIPAHGGRSTRKILRIYGPTAQPLSVGVTLAAIDHIAEIPIETLHIDLQSGRTVGEFDLAPAAAVVDLTDLIEGNLARIPQGNVTATVVSKSGERIWAFVTIIHDPSSRWTNITSHQ